MIRQTKQATEIKCPTDKIFLYKVIRRKQDFFVKEGDAGKTHVRNAMEAKKLNSVGYSVLLM